MQKRIIYFFSVILFLFVNGLSAQDPEMELIRKYAENSFENGDYEFALENYLKLYENNKDDININFRLGVCYTKTNDNKTGGISHLEYVVSHNNFPTDAYYYLGESYMYAYRFTEAVEAFYEYKISGLNDELLAQADRKITMADNALQFITVPVKVDFERLDSTVNSTMNDYRPFVIDEGERMIFSSDYRYVDELEVYISDIYTTEQKNDGWEQAEFWEGNNYEHEEIVGVSPDWDNFAIYSNGDFSTHDISFGNIKRRGIEREKKDFPTDKINTRDFEHGATINKEGNVIYFASNRPGGFGGFDIYKIVKDDDDNWGEPENLGAAINTEYDENFPSFSQDEQTLFFSTKGHASIGGYDLFQANYNAQEDKWAGVRTLGVPINTPYDEMGISFEEDGKVGYIAANRNEGLGKMDIYKVTIDQDATPTIISGSLMVGTEDNAVPYSDEYNKVFVTLYDKFGNVYSRYEAQEGGTFFATIPPGEYTLEIYIDGSDYKYTEDMKIIDTGEDQILPETYFIRP
ncbi:WD40-like Beta Propeller Repeat [Salinivirga cyanobacteriivorans]|uniref:WD40-like Beta Propeller Repeat n=1 Tax=Salinivirga cyanobacteriivorans TaxID=1307839 RepID=A0A0S2I3I1_9BACT|nr:PD40 domain-containing protein [Salinivirga cyanobacteriivorans]ALO17000.1 WD40-like Beta Propeller Repeat [Salinivirga cyanobacteriivorans]